MKIVLPVLVVLTLGACCQQEMAAEPIAEPIVAEEVMTKL